MKKLEELFSGLKRSHIYYGLAAVVLLFIVALILAPKPRLNTTAVIKSAQVKQITAMVAGGNPVQWSVLIKKSDITKNSYLASLPKNAQNIKISNITATQANAIFKAQTNQPSLQQKTQIAKANEPKSYFAASLLDSITKFFTADLSDAVQTVANNTDPQIQTTQDATAVDLSSQVQPDNSPAPTDTATPSPTPTDTSTPAVTPGETPSITNITSPSDSNPTTTPTETATPSPTTANTQVPTPSTTPSTTQTSVPVTLGTTTLSADISSARTLLAGAVVGTDPGDYKQTDIDALQSAINSANSAISNINSLQSDINNADTVLNSAVATFKNSNQYVKVDYTTPAPIITEQNSRNGKIVNVSAVNEDPNNPYRNVLASATIPKIFKDGEESKIQIKWKNNSNQIVTFHAYDTDHSGYLNYVEWTVPHLSDQTFEIILISKAFQLDNSQNILADIYEEVQTQDTIFADVAQGNYVRATFYQTLDNTKDITVYAKATDSKAPASINVYPVYTDASGNQTEGSQITLVSDGVNPNFTAINQYQKYRILLKNLKTPTDMFDLQIGGGSIDIDYIVDPTPTSITDNFTDTTKIASTTNVTVDTASGTVYLSSSSSWTCGSSFIDNRDGQTYTTVQVGGQCWMAQNLNVGTMTAGTNNQGTSCSASDGSDIQKYCYSNSTGNCNTNGGLYQWTQTMCGSTTAGAEGICPIGWHVPTHDEWTTLEQSVCVAGGTSPSVCNTTFPYDTTTVGWLSTSANEGTALKSGGSSGFNGLLAGYRDTDGSFYNLGGTAFFWSSLESGSLAWARYLGSGHTSVFRFTYSQAYGFSVRCLKN